MLKVSFQSSLTRCVSRVAALGSLLFCLCSTALAHAVLVSATPAPNSTVAGPATALALKFNARIDQERSRITIEGPDRVIVPVVIDKKLTEPDQLSGSISKLSPGNYVIHWQVLAVDGHITRGNVAFRVR